MDSASRSNSAAPSALVPAALGGPVPFPEALPISQPTPPDIEPTLDAMRAVLTSFQLTNHRRVREFEEQVAAALGVEHAVALSSCTSGMVLALHVLGVRGAVGVPAFTFPATAHAIRWNGLRPVFLDCDEESLTLDPASLEAAGDPELSAVMPVYVFGNAPDWPAILEVARRRKLTVISDAAQALGTRVGERFAGGFGDAEVFSLAPTKLAYAGEGGVVTTRDPRLAHELRAARNYGHHGDYDSVWQGLNARMSEFHAVVASATFAQLERSIARRETLVALYRERLGSLPGIRFQAIRPEVRSTHNYILLFVEGDRFGLTAGELKEALERAGVVTRRYFHPPVHRQTLYREFAPKEESRLARTLRVSDLVLCLPLFTHMSEASVERVCLEVRLLHEHAADTRRALRAKA